MGTQLTGSSPTHVRAATTPPLTCTKISQPPETCVVIQHFCLTGDKFPDILSTDQRSFRPRSQRVIAKLQALKNPASAVTDRGHESFNMQIDWLSGFVETPPQFYPGYDTGRTLIILPGGEVKSEKSMGLNVATPDDHEDHSFSRNYRVHSVSRGSLYLSGNPIKLLQDHNLWGSTDTLGCFLTAGQYVRQHAGLFPGPSTWVGCEFTGPRYTRIDITRSYRFPNEDDASAFIRHVVGTARSRHGSPKLFGSETAYFGQKSRRWTMKIYRKYPEFIKHFQQRNGLFSPKYNRQLLEWTEGIVRFELTLRSPELNTNYRHLNFNNPETLTHVWNEKFNTIQFNENAIMATQTHIAEKQLSPLLKGVLALWRSGEDVRSIYPTPTFYRHRRSLLDNLGVDINTAPQSLSNATTQNIQLSDAGWDPEPLEGQLKEPDQQLKIDYPPIKK